MRSENFLQIFVDPSWPDATAVLALIGFVVCRLIRGGAGVIACPVRNENLVGIFTQSLSLHDDRRSSEAARAPAWSIAGLRA